MSGQTLATVATAGGLNSRTRSDYVGILRFVPWMPPFLSASSRALSLGDAWERRLVCPKMAPKEAKLAPKDAKLVIPKDPKLAPKDTKLAAQDGKGEAGAAAAAVPGAKKDGKAETGSVEDRINLHQLMELKAAFDRADTDGGGSLDMEEFLDAFGGVLGKNLTHEQLTHLFMKIDANSDGSVDWDEFTNYMLLETQAASNMSDRSYQVCYQDALDKNLGSVWVDPSPKALHHRNMIAGILAIPKQEKFVTHSRDGTVRVWHAGTLAHLRTLRVSESWVTDCKHFPLSNRLVASSIDRTVSFYDAGTYELTSQLTGLDTSPMCIGYWQDPEAESERMILGDDAGNIALYDIAGAADGERAPNGDVMDVPLCAQRLYRDRRHADWVTQCSFYPELNFMVRPYDKGLQPRVTSLRPRVTSLRPHVSQPATLRVSQPATPRVTSLQPHVSQPAAPRVAACNPTCRSLQPHAPHACRR